MAILASDIKFLKSERMTDLPDGGGLPTANEVLDNVDNNVFPDISSGDHVTGYTELRLIYGAVRSANTDTLYSGRVYIASPPAETGVKPFIFPAPFGASRLDLLDVLYRDAQKGGNSNYRLYADYGPGDNTIRVYYAKPPNQTNFPAESLYGATRLCLEDVSRGSVQFISCAVSGYGEDDNVWIETYQLLKPINAYFDGSFFFDDDSKDLTTPTQIYRVTSQEIPIYGIETLAVQANSGASAVTVTSQTCPLATQIQLNLSATATHEGWDKTSGFAYTYIAAAAASRAQVIPVQGAYAYLRTLKYLYQGQWQTYSSSVSASDGYFLVILPVAPDAGSDLVCNALTAYGASASYLSGDEAVFLLDFPVIPGSIIISAVSETPTVLSVTDDGVGGLTGDCSSGSVDYALGLVQVTLTASCTISHVTLEYQYQRLADDLDVGIDLERLPLSKTAPIFRQGDSALIHHSTIEDIANPAVAETTYTLTRANVDQIWLESADGTRIPTAKYTVNLTAGSVTMAAGLDLTGYQQPLKAYTTLQDEAVIVGVSGTTLQLSRALTHTYPADTSYVSSILQLGDLFASVTVPFAQQAWTVWSDTLIGSAITPQFDDVVHPIVVTNDGAITERWRIQFTGTTTVHVIGENVGQIATSVSITGVIAPINPYTGQPYFTIPAGGWGAGWVSGNLLRFNTRSADAALGCGRSIQPGDHTPGSSDRFRLTLLGDVDA